MLARLDAELKGLSPSYFALVMATGIISIAAELLDLRPLAVALFAINVCAYVVLWASTGLRLVRHRARFVADLIDHERGVRLLHHRRRHLRARQRDGRDRRSHRDRDGAAGDRRRPLAAAHLHDLHRR